MSKSDALEANQQTLRETIAAEGDRLHRTLQLYVMRAGLSGGPPHAEMVAREVLNEMTAEALEHAARFDPTRQAIAWLLGIAANLIRRKQVEMGKLNRREPLARDVEGDPGISEDELFDRLFPPRQTDPAERLEQEQAVAALLAHVSKDDQQVIRLAVLHDLDGVALATALNTKEGTARVRLHRALGRLRKALEVKGVH